MYFSIINLGTYIISHHVCMHATTAAGYEFVSLTIDSCIHSAIWEPVMGEELQCGREVDNLHDPYAVSVRSSLDRLWDTSLVAFPDPVQCFCGAMAVEVERFFKYFNSAISIQTITRKS